jgi:hypothetical protein
VTLFATFGALLFAYGWASAWPAKPLDSVLVNPAKGLGLFLIACSLGSALAGRGPLHGLRLPSILVPFYLVDLVPSVTSTFYAWNGGWLLGTAGAVAGAAAGAATGWLFTRLILPDTEVPEVRGRAVRMPIAFALLFALFGAYLWATAASASDLAWGIVILLTGSALPGALVARPVLGLLVASPLILVPMVPLVVAMTLNWEGGWALGIAGAPVGAAAGAVYGWLFNRWIMPEYDKRREHAKAFRPPLRAPGPN